MDKTLNFLDIIFSIGIPKSTVVIVNIHVLDINDNPPVFLNAPVQIQVNETAPVYTELFTLLAHDLDLKDTNNGVTFRSMRSNDYLAVNSNTGAVTLIRTLDHSTKQRYFLNYLINFFDVVLF